MARPIEPITPPDPLLVVDGRTPFVMRTPPLQDHRGQPLLSRSVTVALVSSDAAQAPIHGTLSAAAVHVGDGCYSVVLQPRALWLRLAPHANRRVFMRVTVPGEPTLHVPVLVAWRASTYPTPQAMEAVG